MIGGGRWWTMGPIFLLLCACRKTLSEPTSGTETKTTKPAVRTTPPSIKPAWAMSNTAPLAQNETAIVRYPDETQIAPATLLATRRPSPVRSEASPTNGDVVADLRSGTGVVRIAQRTPFFLILFDDPSNVSRQEMGWLHQDAFLPDPSASRGQ